MRSLELIVTRVLLTSPVTLSVSFKYKVPEPSELNTPTPN